MKKRLLILALLMASLAWGQRVFTDAQGVAIKGYDPVAYFTDARPVRGDTQWRWQWHGATWLFASAEHLALFRAEPEKYAPQYGGFCAYGVAKGRAVKIEPEAWSVVDGKLYLNYDLDIRKDWQKDIPGYIQKADARWPELNK